MKVIEIRNLTPHAITVTSDVYSQTFEPTGVIARVTLEPVQKDTIWSFPCVSYTVTGNNLPPQKEGMLYLVSAMVLSALPERKDLIAPDTNNALRNEKGHIISVPGFVSN